MKHLIFLFFFAVSLTMFGEDNKLYTNPVLHPDNYPNVSSAADPFVFKDTDGTYYCYVTGGGFPVFSSRDLVNWTHRGNAFPRSRAKWANINFWAPEVVKIGDTYYLNYTGAVSDPEPKRIGLATSKSPVGPFDDVSTEPFYSLGAKGCIDSHIFIDDDGRTFLYYSLALRENIVNGVNRSEIWVIELKPDLSGFIGEAKQLFYPTLPWENNVAEAPAMVKRNGIYYLMYSGNGYANAKYAVGYATSSSPMGPFVKYSKNPILINGNLGPTVTGTGHHSVTTSPDGTELICVYHSHINLSALGGGPRKVHIDRMGFTSDGVIYINGPTITPQAYPSFTQKTPMGDLWFDVDFSSEEWMGYFNEAGYDFKAITPGQHLNFEEGTTFVLEDINGFNFNANAFREATPFTSVCGKTFEYSIRLRQNNNPTYIEFPEVNNAKQIILYVQNPNTASNMNNLTLEKKNAEGKWEIVTQWSVPALNLLSTDSDYELACNINIEEPVTLRVYRQEDRFLKIFRIMLEKYNTGSSIKSVCRDNNKFFINRKTLFLPEGASNAKLLVFDLVGKQVYNCEVNSDRIDLQNINPGIYIVKLITKQGETTQKVIIGE